VTKHYQMLLKQAREERGWSQKDVAQKIGTDPKTVSRWERSVAYPSPYFRQKLGELFEKSLRELDLLNPSEKALDDGDLSTSKLPTGLIEELEKASNGHHDEIDQQEVQADSAAVAFGQQTHATALHQQNRRRMLKRLHHAYSELLDYSLQEIAWIELGLAGIPDAVQNAINRLVRLTRQYAQMLAPGTSILEVYETSERALLILGEPGAGKSTLLLHLASALVQQAEQEETHPLPVILNLSSWAEHKPVLEDWMSDQLALTYDVSQKLSTQWVRNEHVLPLLDGLDEMDTASRSTCIAAINAYHREHLLVPLVICCRRAEYEDASRHQKLALQQAVLIQPLTLEQVCATLDQAGHPLVPLRQTLQTNRALQELVTTPLMVSIVLLAYSRTPLPTLSHEVATLQEQVWTDYVAHMIEQKGDGIRYAHQQTCSWLSWLARNLQTHYQTVFYLEHVQIDWLPQGMRQDTLWLTMRLPIMLLGMLSSIILGLFLQTVFDLTTGIQAAILGCFLGGCLSQPAATGAEVVTLKMNQKRQHRRTLRRGLIGAGTGLAIGLSFGCELGPGYRLVDWVRDGLIYGSIIGLTCGVFLVVLPRISAARSSSSVRGVPAQLRHLFSPLHLGPALLFATGLGFAYGLSTALSYGLSYGPSTGLNMALSYAGVTLLISVLVDNYTRDLRLTERLRWTWSGFLHRLRSSQHCVTSAGLALAVLLIVGLSYGLTIGLGLRASSQLGFRLSYGLSDGLSTGPAPGPGTGLAYGLMMGLIVGIGTGLAYWVALGLFQSITQEQLEDQDRQRFNSGVRRSALHSAIIGLLSAGIIAGIGFLGYWLSYALNEGLSKGMSTGVNVGLSQGLGSALGIVWLFAIGGGIVGWAVSGGWALLRHVVLRCVLSRRGVFPWLAQAFLDDAAARILVRRDGGGYSFMHRLLLEYFAQLDDGHAPAGGRLIET
jgi:transcriptional regulator with XRE-family HTH domain